MAPVGASLGGGLAEMEYAVSPVLDPVQPNAKDAAATLMKPRHAGVVVVHSGARDRYQVALALSKAGLLECLVTDFFWSEETPLRRSLAKLLPAKVLRVLRQRSAPGLPPAQVKLCLTASLGSFLLDKARGVPFEWRRWYTRRTDALLGRRAGNIARSRKAGLLSYSYYAFQAFQAAGRPGLLFQMHPHPETMRSLLSEELRTQPDCSASLQQEWELSLPEEDFEKLAAEPGMASHILAASSFTRRSLVEHGTSQDHVTVVPYGIDLQRYRPDEHLVRDTSKPLKLLFVGRINQRKGIKYLLEALALLPDAELELTVCGRIIDGLSLFTRTGSRVRVLPSVSADDLVRNYQSADLLVLPSIGEGFGQVLLEALACGLPVLATTHTAAPDLITDRVEGFLIEPRSPAAIADRVRWALAHREELVQMRTAARACAERFPWSAFQDGVSNTVKLHLSEQKERA